MAVLGLDIGGSGIKGAPVDTQTGELIQPRLRRPTPVPGTPDDVADVIAGMLEHFQWQGKIGCGFPGVVRYGVAINAANMNEKWVGTDIAALLTLRTGCPTTVLNDADAAGMAEMKFGAGRDYQNGVVLMITIGTRIGSAIFVNGNLLPNTEFGHMQVRGKDAEHRASDAVRTAKNLRLEEMGEAGERVPDDHGGPCSAGSDHRRRRRMQGTRTFFPLSHPADKNCPGDAAEQRRDRRGSPDCR